MDIIAPLLGIALLMPLGVGRAPYSGDGNRREKPSPPRRNDEYVV
jgi:hypothetical protein